MVLRGVVIMKLDARKYREALSNLGPRPAVFVDAPPEFRRWLEEKRLPSSLVEFLIVNAVNDNIPFPGGSGGVWTPEDIMSLNERDSAILDGGLIALASAINFDFIVVDLAEGTDQVGFVSHDELWEDSPANVRDVYVPVDESIHEILDGISRELREWMAGTRTSPNYPIDYYSALDRRKYE